MTPRWKAFWQLARENTDRRLLAYAAVHALVRRGWRLAPETSMRLQFRDMGLWTGIGTGELAPYKEICLEQAYERELGFDGAPEATVVDVGASIGVYAMRMARRGCRVFAFEPNPYAFARLQRNIALNGCGDRVRARRIAAYSRAGVVRLHWAEATTLGRVAPDGDGIAVEALPLDDALEDVVAGAVDILKIDVEGAEPEVLSGAARTLARTRGVVLETHPHTRDTVVQTLRASGFRVALHDQHVYGLRS